MPELRAVYRLTTTFLCVVAEHGLTPLVGSLHIQRLIFIYREASKHLWENARPTSKRLQRFSKSY